MKASLPIFTVLWIIVLQLFLAASASGQYTPQPLEKDFLRDGVRETSTLKAADTIWYEDFSGALPGSWQSVDNNGFCAFEHTYDGPQGPFSLGMPPIASQSADNGFMILDSDLCTSQNSGDLTTDAYLQSPSIDILGQSNLMLTFEHSFRYCCSSEAVEMVVEISTDEENWTSFDVTNGLAPNNTSANPVYQAIDIAGLTHDHDQLWIRFRKTGATHYWWMIDDVQLVSYVENDLELTNTFESLGYTKIPDGQQQVQSFGGQVRNVGGKTQHNLTFTTRINTYLFGSEASYPSLDPGQTLNVSVPDDFTAPGPGNYHIEFEVFQDEDDMNPQNNSLTTVFEIGDTVYSRTPNLYDPGKFLESQPGDVFGAANRFTLVQEMEATSVAFAVHENTQEGAAVIAQILRVEEDEYTEIVSTMEYVVENEDINTLEGEPLWVTLSFDNDVLLEAGDYLAVAKTATEEAGFALAAASAPYQPDGASLVHNGNEWETASITPLINLNFGNNQVDCNPMYYFDIQSALCGTASGSIEIFPLTGKEPFHYQWADDPENDAPLLDSLQAGSYEVTITDGYGCDTTRMLTVPDEDISLDYESEPAMCNTGGSVTVLMLNGQEPFTFDWEHDPDLDDATAQDLASGFYSVTVTDTNGCQANITAEVANIDELPVDVLIQDAFCDSPSGSIELIPEGGQAPYSFQWDEFADLDSAKVDSLTAGTYSFVVTDAQNCEYIGTARVFEEFYELELTTEVLDASCGLENGVIQVGIDNGQAPFQYSWSHGFSDSLVDNLAPGTYHLQVTDLHGCPGEQEFTIENAGQMPSVNATVDHPEGCSQSTGSLAIYPDNPEEQYTYSWLNQDDDQDDVTKNGYNSRETVPGFELEDLPAGQYHIGILNEDGCELVKEINISDLGGPNLEPSITDASCFGYDDGAIAINVPDATNPEFLWLDEGNQAVDSIGNLVAGSYSLKVTDEDCTVIETFEVGQPELLHAVAEVNHVVCAHQDSGSIKLDVIGGTAPYAIYWDNAENESTITDLEGGVYNLTITDYHLCNYENSYTLHANDSLLLNATVEHTEVDEDNGVIHLEITGGEGDYTIDWDHGAQGSLLTGLSAGEYVVTVMDEVGCAVTESFMIGTVDVEDHFSEKEIHLYPNPVSGLLNVSLNQECRGTPVHLEVLNILGEKVLDKTWSETRHGSPRIDVSHLHGGMYILRLSCKEYSWQGEFLKK